MAREFAAQVGKLDVLINNAGGIYEPRQETREGIELTWALNHLAYFIVTRELLPLLRTSSGRMVNVSSAAHASGKIHWQDPEFKTGYSAWGAYNQSKLANILFTRELAYREREPGRERQRPASGPGGLRLRAQQRAPGQVTEPRSAAEPNRRTRRSDHHLPRQQS